jgi:hypothetical protein
MRIKPYYTAVLMLFAVLNVNAQIQIKSAQYTTGNFTSFTPQEKYADITKLKEINSPEFYSHPDFGKCFADSIQWYEQIDKRTLKSRTYKGPGNEIIIQSGYDNLNYIDANGWLRAVDTKLKPSSNGWAAEQQEVSLYLHHDGSTVLSLGKNDLMLFNKNVQFNGRDISTNNYTVGDNGMYIKNTVTNTDKIISFGRGRIETDYKITQPLKLNTDLVISEDIILPAGYTISENENYNAETDGAGSLIVKQTDGGITAELKTPFCYDSHGSSVIGIYHFQKQNGGYRLEVDVPSSWLNDPLRQYPVTIDPVVTGPTTKYSGGIIPSCIYPTFDTASIADTIPAAVTVTSFYVQGGFYTKGGVDLYQGFFSFQTSCMNSPIIFSADSANPGNHIEGWVYASLANTNIIHSGATHCHPPSCSAQIFRLIMGVSRDTVDTAGCNARYVYYDPANNLSHPFEAYVVGHTVESSWSIPDSLCGDICTLTLSATSNYGVPPYTITHPWASSPVIFGNYTDSTGTSTGDTVLTLTIPNCPGTITGTLIVPPPTIKDACGNTFGLTADTISVTQAPNKPVITKSGDVLTSSAIQFNQWNLNGNAIKGATHQEDTATTSGCYSVTVENLANDDCSTTSDTLCVTITDINQLSINRNQISIYPNPANNSTTVEFTAAERTVQLALINVLGQTLYSEILTPINGNNYRTNLNLLQLPAGVYEVVITTPSQSVAKEIIKQE